MPIEKKPKDIPFTGKWMTHDPATIGTNFRTYSNMRPGDTHPKSVQGMTKINSSVMNATYLKTRSAFQYQKSQPAENHLLVQSYNTGLTASQVLENTTAIPNTGNFSATALWTDSAGAGRGRFSDAPNGQLAYCNGVDSCLWSGVEDELAKFINYNPDESFWYDFTDKINNTKTDAANIATLKRITASSSTKALWHFADDLTDSSGNSHTLTGTGTPTYSTGLFGKCLTLNGTSQYASVASHADLDMSGGTWTLDGKFRVHSLAAVRPILYWSTAVKSVAFDTGTNEPAVGDSIYGETSSAVGKVLNVVLASGAWDGSGVGTIYYQVTSGTVQSGEHLHAEAAGAGDLFVNTTGAPADAGSNYVSLSVGTTGILTFSVYESYATPAVVVTMASPASTIAINSWYHIEIVEDGNTWYMLVGDAGGTASIKSTVTDANRAGFYTGSFTLGFNGSTYYDGDMEEVRFSNAAMHTASFSVPVAEYSAGTETYLWAASRRPSSAFNFYMGSTVNASAATVRGYEWNGTTLSELTLTDGTAVAGATLAQDGAISYASTVATAKPKIIKEVQAYFYLFVFTGLDDNVTVERCTVTMPFQPVKDMWDGVYRDISKFLYYNVRYSDQTVNALRKDYDATSALTYVEMGGGFTTAMHVVVQSMERLQGFYFLFPSSLYVNSTANTIMTIEYWNGSAWATVGSLEDGTSVSGISWAQTGSVTFQSPAENLEFTRSINGGLDYYSYRISFSQTLSVGYIQLDYVGGIAASRSMGNYKFPVFAQGRLLLCADMTGDKFKFTCSNKDMPDVYSGIDSVDVYLGDSGELTCGVELFSLFGNSLYSLIFIFKDTESWVVSGTDINAWGNNSYMIADDVGCPTPETLKTVHLAQEPASGVNRALVIWQGAHGVFVSDGRAPIPVHGDIKAYFDPTDSRCIKSSMIGDSVAWIDTVNQEYHLLIASGSSATTLNTELVYDIIRNKWFVIDRTVDLQYGVLVHDTDGNAYTYGFLDTGYMERLEYGNTFDGAAIVSEMVFGDFLPADTISVETMIDRMKLVTVAKSTTTNSIAATHYGDGINTGTALRAKAPQKSNYRIASPFQTDNLGGFTFHSFGFSMTANNETVGFEPLAMSIIYHVMR